MLPSGVSHSALRRHQEANSLHHASVVPYFSLSVFPISRAAQWICGTHRLAILLSLVSRIFPVSTILVYSSFVEPSSQSPAAQSRMVSLLCTIFTFLIL